MTEDEYINATNLAKLRIAQAAFRDCLFMHPAEADVQSAIVGKIWSLIQAYEGKVKTKPSPQDR